MTIAERLSGIEWAEIEESLWRYGYARTPKLLSEAECRELIALYPQAELFRSRIEMARYRFGEGEYQYFADPLPSIVAELRDHAYTKVAPVANRWMEALGEALRFPGSRGELAEVCRNAGQTRPTPLMLKYKAGDYNCLHQDLYGDVAFPLQMAFFLSRPGRDYDGGEFLLVEQQPHAQSVGHAVRPEQGEAVVFSTRHRPAKSKRGYYRASMRHGVSRVLSGERYVLGIIFHDAK